jgi:competence protein ComEC
LDAIEQKLAELEQRERTFLQKYQQAAYLNPLVFAAAGLIAGTIIQSRLNFASGILLSSALVLSVGFIALSFIYYKYQPKSIIYFTSLFAVLCFSVLGAIRLHNYKNLPADNIANFVNSDQALATVQAVVLTQPKTYKTEWVFDKLKFCDEPSGFIAGLEKIKCCDGFRKVSGKVKVFVNEPLLGVNCGDYVQLYCRLSPILKPQNPGRFDYHSYMQNRNIHLSASVESHNAVKIITPAKSSIPLKIKQKITSILNDAFFNGKPPVIDREAVMQALLFGVREKISKDVFSNFQKTGLLHFISLSGLHIGILIISVWFICRRTGLLEKSSAAICLFVILLFCIVVPLRSATFRAAVIGIVFCLSQLFSRRPSPFNTLALSAVVLILIRPTCIFEPGWQLSFACVIGILLFSKRIFNFLTHGKNVKNYNYFSIKTVIRRLNIYISGLFAVSLSAWLATAGVLLYHFYTINLTAPVWSVLVFPFIFLILITGYSATALSFIVPFTAALISQLSNLLTDILLRLVELISHFSANQIIIGKVSAALVIFYYAVIALPSVKFLVNINLKKPLFAALIILIAGLFAEKWMNVKNSGLSLDCLSVGHGQAIVVRPPYSGNMIFDCGSLSRKDIGTKIVNPFLKYKGIDKINTVFMSHSDIDHINAVPELCGEMKPDRVYAGYTFFDEEESYSETLLLDYLEKENVNMLKIPESINIRKTYIKTLHPVRDESDELKNLSENNLSAVFLVTFAGKNILICSDIEEEIQKKLLTLYPDLKTDIIIAPHHGSKNSLYENFLTKLSAEYIVCSCGYSDLKKNRVIDSNTANSKIFYTPADGAVSALINQQGQIQIKCFNGGTTKHP